MTEYCAQITRLSQEHCCKAFQITELSFKICAIEFQGEKQIRNYTCSNTKAKFESLFLNITGTCFDAYRQLIFYSTIRTRHVIKVSKLQTFFNMFFNITRYERKFPYVFEKDDPNLPSLYEVEEDSVEFVSKVEEQYHHFFYHAIEIVANCIRKSCHKKTTDFLNFCRQWNTAFKSVA